MCTAQSLRCWQVSDELNPLRVLELFQRASQEDCSLLALAGRPEHLLLTHVPVPPVCIRPSVEMDTGGSNEDDLTIKLMVRLWPYAKCVSCRAVLLKVYACSAAAL